MAIDRAGSHWAASAQAGSTDNVHSIGLLADQIGVEVTDNNADTGSIGATHSGSR